jgi:hypothetical protein
LEPTLGGEWLELLSAVEPGLKRAATMFNRYIAPISTYMPSFETAARSLKLVPIVAPVRGDIEIEIITGLGREPGGGLVVISDVFAVRASRVDHIGGGPKQRTGSLLPI